MTDNRDALARHWHNMTDHATDGTPFGGPLCNCKNLAPRLARIKADAAAETIAAVEAVLDESRNGAAFMVGAHSKSHTGANAVRAIRAALSAGRTALDTRLAQAWDEGYRAVDDANPYEASGEGQ